jgi:hypothetical protein
MQAFRLVTECKSARRYRAGSPSPLSRSPAHSFQYIFHGPGGPSSPADRSDAPIVKLGSNSAERFNTAGSDILDDGQYTSRKPIGSCFLFFGPLHPHLIIPSLVRLQGAIYGPTYRPFPTRSRRPSYPCCIPGLVAVSAARSLNRTMWPAGRPQGEQLNFG